MGILRFPTNIDSKKNPYVMFIPYLYKVPSPNLYFFETGYKKEKASHLNEIAIYMPGNFSENINSSWSPESVYQGGNGANFLGNAFSQLVDTKGSNVDGGKLVASVEAGVGAMPFPTDINIFRGTDPMSIPFSFMMIPYNKEEAKSMMDIAKNFKKGMMATRGAKVVGMDKATTKNMLLEFPATWDITVKNMTGLGIDGDSKFPNMCLTGCTVDYSSGTEGASVFEDGSYPVGIRLNLSFTSLRKHFEGSNDIGQV